MILPFKASTFFCAKAALFWRQNVGEIDPGVATSLKHWCSGSLS